METSDTLRASRGAGLMAEDTRPLRMDALADLLLNGYQVIESLHLTKAGEPYQVRRSWRERLLGRPWRPFAATRTVVPQVPSQTAFLLNSRTLVMHPEMHRELKRQLGAITHD